MSAIASQITSLMIVYSTIYPGADQSKHQSSASLAFVWGIHRGPVNSPHKWPVTRKMFPFDDVIMVTSYDIMDFVYHSFKQWLVSLSAPSHYLNQWWFIISLNIMPVTPHDCDWNKSPNVFLEAHNLKNNLHHFLFNAFPCMKMVYLIQISPKCVLEGI